MASKIKGLTIEIGGDTTKLGQALEDVNKKSRDLSSELGSINKLLKLDPTNVELLSQKQKVLADAISNTSDKLDTLKEAEKQVQEQFKRGEVSEEQVRALQREIIATENKLNGYEKAAEETAEQINNVGKKSKEAGDETSKFGEKVKSAGELAVKGFKIVASAAGALVGALAGCAEATREYRVDMDKLDTAFTIAGHSSEVATETYKCLQGVLGESDQAVEAANHLAKLCDNQEELSTWTQICTGVYATFGASLPIEGLTEAANETAKTGAITGSLADALNWAGVSEDDFQTKLDKCSTEQERQALITETLNDLYSEAAEKYKEVAAETIRANEANEAWTAAMAEVGASVEPVLTDVKLLGASLLTELVPGVTSATDAFRDMVNGVDGAAVALGSALSELLTGLLNKVSELAPTAAEVATSLVTTMTTTIISMLPEFVATGIDIIIAIQSGLVSAIPQIVAAVVAMIPQLVQALVTGFPQMMQGALELFMAICDAIPLLLVALIPEIPTIVTTIIDTLISMAPQLFATAVTLLWEIINAIPEIVMGLFESLPSILETIQNVLSATPEIISAIWEQVKTVTSEWVNNMAEKAQEMGKTFVSKAKDKLKDLTNQVRTIIDDTLEKVKTWVKDMVEKAKEAGGDFLDNLINNVKNLPTNVNTIFRDTINKVKEWTTNMVTTAKNAATNTFNSICNTLKGLPATMLTIGGNVVEGVWNGINNKIEWIKAQLRKFKDAVIAALKREFGIASPSKLMRDEIGNYLAEGVAVGISESDAPTDAVRDMRNDILNEARDINGITLERQLNTTFRSDQTFTMAETGILGRLDSILRAIENGQIIAIDGEALVGATLSNIERKLGQNHILAERGVA